VPIIALTAAAADQAVQRSLAAGCDLHVSKPVRKATLIEAIRKATNAMAAAAPSAALIGADGGDNVGRLIVQVDRDLSDLIPGFLEHKRNDARIIAAAIDRADYDELGRIGHKMKGEGGSYGLDTITDIGAALERAAAGRNLAALQRCAEELRHYLESIDIVYG
jgi:HPt (histidine-containing phosphotransfer) domain-containing protein